MSTPYLDSYRLITQARSTLERLMSLRLKPHGLTIQQFNLLELLVKNKATMPAHLSEPLGISASGVTLLVDQLERKHLLERLRDQMDRRTVKLQPTPAGAQAHDRASAALAQPHSKADIAVPEAYFDALNALLKAF